MVRKAGMYFFGGLDQNTLIGSGVVESSNRRVATQNSNKLECKASKTGVEGVMGL